MADRLLMSDYAWCESLIKQHSSSFYRAFRVMPADRARAVYAIYAFCRLADDAIDVQEDPGLLDELESGLDLLVSGNPPDQPLWRALADVFTKFPLDIKPFYEMIHGQREDADFHQPADEAGLLNYCYLVAGTVGLMLCPLLGGTGSAGAKAKLEKTSVELGIAMQLTNILRDIGSDYRSGRIYIPHELLQRYQLEPEQLILSEPAERFIALWEYIANEAERRYGNVRNNIRVFDHAGRLPVMLAMEYYSRIIPQARKADYKVASRRVFVPDWKKLLILLQVRHSWRKMKN